MKKTKLPGENISLKTKKSEDPLIMLWLNSQSNLMDSLRYLVENEIALNGVRNLQAFVPMERSRLQGSSALQQGSEINSPLTGEEQLSAAIAEVSAAVTAPIPDPKASPVVEEEIDDDDIEAWS
ncbi:hypothetical protein AB4Z17_04935 [Paenibacillus sp. TAF43_2]|uniref:hypothetical protein n=1 Tax=Paenibacillus sp. TAF43_2 TaxID=3233069 RepID=UPI003F98A41B